MKLLGLLLAYAGAYVAGALVFLRLLTGEWPVTGWPGSRRDWFDAELVPERRSVLQRFREALNADVRVPRTVDLYAHERRDFGVALD